MVNSGKNDFLKGLIDNPKRIFLIDALGALLSSILLFGILAQLRQYFGMPSKTLYLLSGTAFCLFIFSISCHLLIKSEWKPYLRIIIICNTIYSILTIGLIYKNYEKLTELGMIYFALELIVIVIIIRIEYYSFWKQRQIKPTNYKPAGNKV